MVGVGRWGGWAVGSNLCGVISPFWEICLLTHFYYFEGPWWPTIAMHWWVWVDGEGGVSGVIILFFFLKIVFFLHLFVKFLCNISLIILAFTEWGIMLGVGRWAGWGVGSYLFLCFFLHLFGKFPCNILINFSLYRMGDHVGCG